MNETERRELYKHLKCDTSWIVGSVRDSVSYSQAFGLQAKVDKIVAYYEKHHIFCTSPEEMIGRIRNEWVAGLGPIASWLMWMAIKNLVTQVVRWLWSRYNP
jgi:hypothetical protein